MDSQKVLSTGFHFKKNEYSNAKDLIRALVLSARDEKMVFRGVSNINQLRPTINRVTNRETEYKEKDASKLEYRFLYDFKKYAASMLNGNLDLLDIVAYAQHYGLPTRLIDWTRDPFVALYFAINKEKCPPDGYKLFYANIDDHTMINRSYGGFTYGNLTYGVEFIEEYDNFIKSIKNKERLAEILNTRNDQLREIKIYEKPILNANGLLFYECNASNPRLIAQQGLFSIPSSIEGEDAKNEIVDKTDYITIRIDDRERSLLLKFLDNLNYSNLRLFPDIQSIAEYIVLSNLNDNENR